MNNIPIKKYLHIHYWLRSNYGNASLCENIECLGISKIFNWALKKGRLYKKNRENFMTLCKSCHTKYDSTEDGKKRKSLNSRNTVKNFCIKGHEFSLKNTYKIIRKNNKISRNCRICRNEAEKNRRLRLKIK